MSLAVSCGLGNNELVELGEMQPKVDPANVVLVGARDLDEREKDNIRDSNITVYTMRDIDERGMGDVMEEAIGIVSNGVAGIHVSFDLDVVDPEFAPGTGTPVLGGISYREAHLAAEMMGERRDIVSIDLVEVNPVLDTRNQTARLAAELAQGLLGRRII